MTIEDVPCLKSEDVDIKNIPHKAAWTSWVNDFNDFNNQVMAIGNFPIIFAMFLPSNTQHTP